VATALAVALGVGWYVDRRDHVHPAVAQDIRDVLAAWADLLEISAGGGRVTDAQLSAAGVLPGGDNIRDVLDSMRRVGREFDAEDLQVSYSVGTIKGGPTAIAVEASLHFRDATAPPPDHDSDYGDPREFTFLRTNVKPGTRSAEPDPAAVAEPAAAARSDTAPPGTAGAETEGPARATPAGGTGTYVRLVSDRTGQHCCMPIFP
jgi:hypothetical protein